MEHKFMTTIIQAEGKNATGIQIPSDIIDALNSGKRPRVKIQLNGYTYQTTVAAYGDVFMIPLSAEHRTAANVQANDEVEVTLELDSAPRIIEVPDYFEDILTEHGIKETFDALAPSKRKEFVRQVTSAKAEDTRQRRIDKIIEQLKSS